MFNKLKSPALPKMSALFIILVTLSTVGLLISNVIANKLFPLFDWNINGNGLTMTCAVILFPTTYILSDVFSEVYGYKWSRITNWIAFGANILMVLFFELADLIPAVGYQNATGYSSAFHSILGIDLSNGYGPLGVLIASLAAYIIGSFVDDIVFAKMRKRQLATRDSTFKFCVRAITSSFAGELVDSCIFIPLMLGFAGLYGTAITVWYQVVLMIAIQATIKTLYELCIVPLTAIVVKKVRRYEDSFYLRVERAD